MSTPLTDAHNFYLLKIRLNLFEIFRRWVARIFTVWRTHSRTFIIVSHTLAHHTLISDNRTRTRTFAY